MSALLVAITKGIERVESEAGEFIKTDKSDLKTSNKCTIF